MMMSRKNNITTICCRCGEKLSLPWNKNVAEPKDIEEMPKGVLLGSCSIISSGINSGISINDFGNTNSIKMLCDNCAKELDEFLDGIPLRD